MKELGKEIKKTVATEVKKMVATEVAKALKENVPPPVSSPLSAESSVKNKKKQSAHHRSIQ